MYSFRAKRYSISIIFIICFIAGCGACPQRLQESKYNTSFNIHEEPIVHKPEEGLVSLFKGVIDVFVCGDYICKLKKD